MQKLKLINLCDCAPDCYQRTPGSMKAVYFMETIIEHVADTLGKDPLDLRMLNMYKQGEVSNGWDITNTLEAHWVV